MRRLFYASLLLAAMAMLLSARPQTDRGTISGKIMRGPRQPVFDAIVKFTLERSPAGFRRTTKSRPPDGKFSDEMPQGWVLVSVFKKDENGGVWVGKDRVKVDTNFGANIQEIRLSQQKGEPITSLSPSSEPTAVIEGVLSNGQKPVGGFITVNNIQTGDELAAVRVGGDGHYQFTLPNHDEYLFTAMGTDESSRLVVVNVASNSRVDISLGE